MKSGKAVLGRRGQCPGPADIWPFGGCLSSQSRKAVGNWVEESALCVLVMPPLLLLLFGGGVPRVFLSSVSTLPLQFNLVFQ